jgi:hypothetical protein
MDSKLDRVLHDLRILARIPRNGRIRKSSMGRVTLESDDYLVSLRRLYNRDSREQTLLDITAIFTDAFHEVNSILSHKYMTNLRPTVPAQPPPPPIFYSSNPVQVPSSSTSGFPPELSSSPRLFEGDTKSVPIAIPNQNGFYGSPYGGPLPVTPTGTSSMGSEHEDERRRLLNALGILYKDMLRAVEGVTALKLSTYSSDIAVVTRLDRLIERVHFCIKEIANKVPFEVLTEYSVSPQNDSILEQL